MMANFLCPYCSTKRDGNACRWGESLHSQGDLRAPSCSPTLWFLREGNQEQGIRLHIAGVAEEPFQFADNPRWSSCSTALKQVEETCPSKLTFGWSS